ncbi:hypothetical protein GH714_010906 [Hevea brasiliensis]|uniref:Uncharacterized protein n=1 Tax=Hevea brasiliensis TaxID=3981 RepID=A0A6A6M7Q0_HEVBR|nr:hypothetical protein GH714_010906 [Hevea brasiliensis]
MASGIWHGRNSRPLTSAAMQGERFKLVQVGLVAKSCANTMSLQYFIFLRRKAIQGEDFGDVLIGDVPSHEEVVFDGLFKKVDDLNAMLVEKMQAEREVYM